MKMINKLVLVFIFLIIPQILFAHSPSQCLKEASNSDLLSEVRSRMNGNGGNDGESEVSLVNFMCDINTLHISLISQSGDEQSAEVDTLSGGDCNKQVQILSRSSHKIKKVKVVAACYGSDLYRFALTNKGNINELDTTTKINIEACMKEMKAINER